jgi:hypothetical protein
MAICAVAAAIVTGGLVHSVKKFSMIVSDNNAKLLAMVVSCNSSGSLSSCPLPPLIQKIWNASSAACDFLIAACMMYYVNPSLVLNYLSGSLTPSQLLRHKSIPNSRTHNQVMRLIKIIIETGILTGWLKSL